VCYNNKFYPPNSYRTDFEATCLMHIDSRKLLVVGAKSMQEWHFNNFGEGAFETFKGPNDSCVMHDARRASHDRLLLACSDGLYLYNISDLK